MSLQIKKRQYLLLGSIAGTLTIIIGILAFLGNRQEPSRPEVKIPVAKHNLASSVSKEASEAFWIEKIQNTWRQEQEKGAKRDKDLHAIKSNQKEQIEAQKTEISALKSLLSDLSRQVVDLQTKTPMLNDNFPTESLNQPLMESGFIQYQANLNKIKKPRIKTTENYVFSNTFVKAVVLQGADASAGVLGQSNPDVMLLQILDDGIMPNKHHSHLKDCFISVSVVGDISSERGKIRTERLSCLHKDGSSLDTQVTGIVSDSKNGIRGRVVWRDQPMLEKAFWGSFWESVGNVGQQYATEVSSSPLGNVSTIQPAKIPLAASSGGASGAAKMYAQYNIKRAEMYHPVIQLPPGMIVNVVFLKGFWLDGGTEEQEPEKPARQQENISPEEQEAKEFFKRNPAF